MREILRQPGTAGGERMTRDELLAVAKPILFNTEMVQAILDGLKTVTRRCVKPKSKYAYGFFVLTNKSDGTFAGVYDYDEDENAFDKPQKQPAYKGDILYVRETWAKSDECCGMANIECGECSGCQYLYRATTDVLIEPNIWHPSIHMPKEAARIFLRVTDVNEQLRNFVFSAGGANAKPAGQKKTFSASKTKKSSRKTAASKSSKSNK